MSQPYVGEIRIFAGNFAPNGWMFCQGQLLPIDQYDTLFNLIGTTYGGDGQQTFALPNLSSRLPIHQGGGFNIGSLGGAEQVTLTVGQLPSHSHVAQGATAGTSNSPNGNFWAGTSALGQFVEGTAADETMAPGVMGHTGGGQPHDNMVPFLGLNFILSLFGIFPSQG